MRHPKELLIPDCVRTVAGSTLPVHPPIKMDRSVPKGNNELAKVDVICGRRGSFNHNRCNVWFRDVVSPYRAIYAALSRLEKKPLCQHFELHSVTEGTIPGDITVARFWHIFFYESGDDVALAKTRRYFWDALEEITVRKAESQRRERLPSSRTGSGKLAMRLNDKRLKGAQSEIDSPNGCICEQLILAAKSQLHVSAVIKNCAL